MPAPLPSGPVPASGPAPSSGPLPSYSVGAEVFPEVWRDDRMLLGDRVRWHGVEVSEDVDETRALLVAVVREGRTTLLGRGEPESALDLVRRRIDQRVAAGASPAVGWMSLPRPVTVGRDVLEPLELSPYSTWDWMVTDAEPGPTPAEDEVVVLDPVSEAAAIRRCLAEANPGTTADPAGPEEASWMGVRDDGELVGVVGAVRRGGRPGGGPGSWHLHGLGVLPDTRGRGLGAALTAAVTRAGLRSGAPWVSLGMYADNDVARRIYQDLGFVTEAEFVSFGPVGADRPPT